MDYWNVSDPEWVRNRKARWDELQPRLLETFYSSATKSKWRCLQDYFLTGKIKGATSSHQEAGVTGWDKILLHPALNEQLIQNFLSEGPAVTPQRPRSADFFRWFIHGVSHPAFNSEQGCCDGQELLIVNTVVPREFDVLRWQADEEVKYSNASHCYIPPVEMCAMFAHYGNQFLFDYAVNPHAPVQYLVDYWKCVLPYVDGEFVAGYETTLQDIDAFFHLIRHFCEPRNEMPEHSLAVTFREKVYSILENGTGNAFIDERWKRSADVFGPISVGVERAIFSPNPTPSSLKHLVNAYCAGLQLAERWDEKKLSVVDVGNVLWWGLAAKIGYPTGERQFGKYDVFGAPVPAIRYVLEGETRLENGVVARISLNIFKLIRPDGLELDPSLPQFMILPNSPKDDEDWSGAKYALLIERKLARQIEERTGMCCALRAFILSGERIDVLRRHGSEYVWDLTSYFENDKGEELSTLIAPWPDERYKAELARLLDSP